MSIKFFLGLSFLIITFTLKGQDSMYVAKYKADKQCAVSYTFDDGLLEHYTVVFPKLEKLGFKATFWVNGKTIDDYEKGIPTEKPRVKWKDLKTMAEHGQEISNHGWSHKSLPRISSEEVLIEINRNDSLIEAKIGERPLTFCYAGNAKTPEVVRLASVNRVGTRTSQFSVGSKSTPENLDRRIDTLLSKHEWGVTMTHGITYGYDAFKSDSVLWNHLDKVKALENKIWVATFRDVAAYTAEQHNIKLEVKKKRKKMIVKPSLSLDKKLFSYPLTMVIMKKGIRAVKVTQKGKAIHADLHSDKVLFDFAPDGGDITIKFN